MSHFDIAIEAPPLIIGQPEKDHQIIFQTLALGYGEKRNLSYSAIAIDCRLRGSILTRAFYEEVSAGLANIRECYANAQGR